MPFLELSPALNKLLDLFTFPIAHLIVVPLNNIYHSIRYLIYGRPFPNWSYRIYIAINRRRILANSYSWHRVAARDVEEDTLPTMSIKYTADCDLKKIDCPPFVEAEYSPEVLEKTRGITIREAVPSFWIQKRGGKSVSPSLLSVHSTPSILLTVASGARPSGFSRRKSHILHRRWRLHGWTSSSPSYGLVARQNDQRSSFLYVASDH